MVEPGHGVLWRCLGLSTSFDHERCDNDDGTGGRWHVDCLDETACKARVAERSAAAERERRERAERNAHFAALEATLLEAASSDLDAYEAPIAQDAERFEMCHPEIVCLGTSHEWIIEPDDAPRRRVMFTLYHGQDGDTWFDGPLGRCIRATYAAYWTPELDAIVRELAGARREWNGNTAPRHPMAIPVA